ncbi:hypothetical protein NMY22_g16636 [Coprinellus aureogranulatus]|nr:hypothetical protein NMY22_g16636 [Coprinellus aureogranulatus]
MSELENVDLEKVGKVDEHVRLGFFLSAGDVEAHCDDVDALPPFRELVFHGEGVQPCCGQADLLREPQRVGYALDLPLGCTMLDNFTALLQRTNRLRCHSSASWTSSVPEPQGIRLRTGSLRYKAALHNGSAIIRLPERNLVNDSVLFNDGSTADAEAIAGAVSYSITVPPHSLQTV